MKRNYHNICFLISLSLVVTIFTTCKQNKGLSSSRVVSIKDFGAKGNDKKDDTESIQNALNHLDRKKGGTLIIPKGTYMISRRNLQFPGGIYIPSNVKVKGEDRKKSILKLQKKQGNFTRVIYVERSKNVSIENLTIDGSRYEQINPESPNEHLHGIFIHAGIDVLIRDCNFQNTGGDGVYIHGGKKEQSKNILVRNCSFKDNRRNGITLGSGFNGVVIDSCFFDATNIYASPIDSEPDFGKCENAKFTNNTVVNHKDKATIITLGGHVPVVGYEVSNNKLENCGLHLVRAYDAEINNNEITVKDKALPGIQAIYESKNINIYNNKIRSVADGVKLIATKVSYPSGFSIHNNVIEVSDHKAQGIRIQGARNIEIKNNTLFSNCKNGSDSGVYIRSTREVDNIIIKGNKIKNFKDGLTLATYQKYKIAKLTFKDNVFDISDKGQIINYTCPKKQIGSQVKVVSRNNEKKKISKSE